MDQCRFDAQGATGADDVAAERDDSLRREMGINVEEIAQSHRLAERGW